MRAVFGPGFLALPRFVAANAADLAASRADAARLLGGDPLAAHTWLMRMERVRPPLARMTRPLREAELLGTRRAARPAVVQVPHAARPAAGWASTRRPRQRARCRWSCRARPPTSPARSPASSSTSGPRSCRRRTETTGIAFQYDPPDAAAPQAILLAVPPVLGQPWRVGTLNRVLLETLDLARLRLVGPEDLGDLGHYLPAAYLAFNAEGDAVSTDMNPLAP